MQTRALDEQFRAKSESHAVRAGVVFDRSPDP